MVRRGEIYYADLSPVVGSEQGGVRPVLVVQNNVGNRYSPTVIAAAITSKLDKAKLPTHIALAADSCGLAQNSVDCPLTSRSPPTAADWRKTPWCCSNRYAPSTNNG